MDEEATVGTRKGEGRGGKLDSKGLWSLERTSAREGRGWGRSYGYEAPVAVAAGGVDEGGPKQQAQWCVADVRAKRNAETA